MSAYPGYPDQRIIVNNVDLTTEFSMVLLDGFVLNPPEPKTSLIDIPGGDGFIDLTEAMTGDVVYSQRKQEFTFAILYPTDSWEVIKTKVNNFIHGRSFEYRLTFDPDYKYRGRFNITSYEQVPYTDGIVGYIQMEVYAEPYKYKDDQVFNLTAPGGRWFYFVSGRKPVRPVIETKNPCTITWNRKVIKLGVGTFRLNDVLFTQGSNAIYINTLKITNTLWREVGQSGRYPLTWDEARSYTWDEIQRMNLSKGDSLEEPDIKKNSILTWGDMMAHTWQEYYDEGIRWVDLGYSGYGEDFTFSDDMSPEDFIVYLKYEWGDL